MAIWSSPHGFAALPCVSSKRLAVPSSLHVPATGPHIIDDVVVAKCGEAAGRHCPGTGESGVLARGQVVLVDIEVIVANPPLALIQALRGQILDASLQHELASALPGRIVHPRP
jgi:hypothetical protein